MLRRARQRAPNLSVGDRLLCGFESLFLSPGRIRKVAIGVRPSTLLAFHQALVRRKSRRLFSSSPRPKKPGPKGPSEALIRAIVEFKSRNPRFGCPRIARIISRTFGIDIDKNVVHRVLLKHYRPAPGETGPSWLSFIGHATDRLIGTMWREFLDHVLFWNARDLEHKLADFQVYYNGARGHESLAGETPAVVAGGRSVARAKLSNARWVPPLPGSGSATSGGLTTNSRPIRQVR